MIFIQLNKMDVCVLRTVYIFINKKLQLWNRSCHKALTRCNSA
ncbi:hypothetical protein EK904_007482, partial [Melospiza melodia maxima]